MIISGRKISINNSCYIVAELGVNHEGNLEMCKKMIYEASKAGADAVKLQTFDPNEHYTPNTESYKIFKKTSFNFSEIRSLFKLAKKLNIHIFSTCGDEKTIDLIDSLNPVAYKISSGMIEHFPIIKYLCTKDRPLIISTGMAETPQIDKVINLVKKYNVRNFCLLHCVSIYPTPKEQLNLLCIRTLAKKYKIPVGFSDHSIGGEAMQIAVSLGARIIEKHFTLDRRRRGFDHKISMTPMEFKKTIKKIRSIELAIGNGEKKLSQTELINRNRLRRVIVAKKEINIGKKIDDKDLSIMRVLKTKKGISPVNYDKIIGKKVIKKISKFEVLTINSLSK